LSDRWKDGWRRLVREGRVRESVYMGAGTAAPVAGMAGTTLAAAAMLVACMVGATGIVDVAM